MCAQKPELIDHPNFAAQPEGADTTADLSKAIAAAATSHATTNPTAGSKVGMRNITVAIDQDSHTAEHNTTCCGCCVS